MTALDQPRIRRVVRQRHPMLMLDRVTEVDPPETITAIKAVTVSEPCYARLGDGLGPHAFAYPAALLIESFGQAVTVLWSLSGHAAPDTVPLLASMLDVILPASATPGDVLEHRARLEHAATGSWIYSGVTLVAGRPVLQVGSLMVVARAGEALTGS